MTTKKLLKFFPLVKVEDSGDGVTKAYGIVTGESPDKEGEICDYAFAKKSYQDWSGEAAESTTAAGQEVSLGNIRLQHTLQIAGKAVKLDFDDKKKTISVGSQSEDAQVRKLLKGGYVRGYSQGGSYAFRKCNTCETDIEEGRFCPSCKKQVYVRYGPMISEVSYVDNPCFKQAKFSMVKGAKFQLVKSDGSTETAGFQEGEDSMQTDLAKKLDTLTALVQKALSKDGKSDDKNPTTNLAGAAQKALAEHTDGKAIKAFVDTKVAALIEKKAEAKGLKKGMYEVSRFASILQDIAYLRVSSEYEREREGDESTLPEDLQQELEALAECFLAMAEEESTELTTAADQAGKIGGPLYMSEKTAGLEKAARKSVAEHAKAMKDSISEHCDKVSKAMGDHKDAMCAHVDKLTKILGAEETGEKGDEPTPDDLSGATANTLKATVAELQKTVAELKKEKPAAEPGFVSIGKTSDGVEIFKKAEPAAAAPAAPAATAADDKPITKADLDKAMDTAFNAGAQLILKALKGEEEEPGKDGKESEEAKKAAAATKLVKTADGVGDRSNTTLLNGGPVMRVMPVRKAEDEIQPTGAAPAAQPAAADVSKAMTGDRTEALKFMKSAKPQELPPTITDALSKRHHSAI